MWRLALQYASVYSPLFAILLATPVSCTSRILLLISLILCSTPLREKDPITIIANTPITNIESANGLVFPCITLFVAARTAIKVVQNTSDLTVCMISFFPRRFFISLSQVKSFGVWLSSFFAKGSAPFSDRIFTASRLCEPKF